MRHKRVSILIIIGIILVFSTSLKAAEGEQVTEPAVAPIEDITPVAEPAAPTEEPAATAEPAKTPIQIVEPEVLWLWGEVASVDAANKVIVVKYLDYETDTEKEISINTDDKTTYENTKSTEEIKPQDTVSIDYIVDSAGNNIAKNISLEKAEAAQVVEPEGTEATPEEMTTPPEGKETTEPALAPEPQVTE
jgi:hypothetical protein